MILTLNLGLLKDLKHHYGDTRNSISATSYGYNLDNSNHMSTSHFLPEDLRNFRVSRRFSNPNSKEKSRNLFDIIHEKFIELGHGYHGAPVQYFKYHMDKARWIHIEPLSMGKVVVSNTCSQVRKFIYLLFSLNATYYDERL